MEGLLNKITEKTNSLVGKIGLEKSKEPLESITYKGFSEKVNQKLTDLYMLTLGALSLIPITFGVQENSEYLQKIDENKNTTIVKEYHKPSQTTINYIDSQKDNSLDKVIYNFSDTSVSREPTKREKEGFKKFMQNRN